MNRGYDIQDLLGEFGAWTSRDVQFGTYILFQDPGGRGETLGVVTEVLRDGVKVNYGGGRALVSQYIVLGNMDLGTIFRAFNQLGCTCKTRGIDTMRIENNNAGLQINIRRPVSGWDMPQIRDVIAFKKRSETQHPNSHSNPRQQPSAIPQGLSTSIADINSEVTLEDVDTTADPIDRVRQQMRAV